MAKLKILLVDDEVDFLETMGPTIEGWGYGAIKAESGKEAVDILRHKNPDIIILDYMMPRMDGIATLREIRNIDKKIPVVMFTAYPDSRSIKGARNLGVSAFIPKVSVFSDAQDALKTVLAMVAKMLSKGE